MRIIDKLPKTPKFNETIVRLITAFLFLKDQEGKFYPETILQIMGNIAFLDNLSHKALNVIKENPDTNIIISGGINPNYKENSQETGLVKKLYVAGGKRNWHDALTIPEAEIIQKELNNIGIQKSLLLETTSTNSKENFQNASELGYYKEAKHLTILTTKENTLRTKLTAQQNLPQFKESQISTIGYTASVDALGIKVDENHWAENELSKQYVYGEFLRIAKYTEMGEISLSEKQLINLENIIKSLNKYQK